MTYEKVKLELKNIKIQLKTSLKNYFVHRKFEEIQVQSEDQAKLNRRLTKKMGLMKMKKFSRSTSSNNGPAEKEAQPENEDNNSNSSKCSHNSRGGHLEVDDTYVNTKSHLDCIIEEYINLRQINIDLCKEAEKAKLESNQNQTNEFMSVLQNRALARENNIDEDQIYDFNEAEANAQPDASLRLGMKTQLQQNREFRDVHDYYIGDVQM